MNYSYQSYWGVFQNGSQIKFPCNNFLRRIIESLLYNSGISGPINEIKELVSELLLLKVRGLKAWRVLQIE